MNIKMGDVSILISRKPIKHIYLRFNASSGLLNVSVPLKLPLNAIQSQINARHDWINKTHARITQSATLLNTDQTQNNTRYFLGKKHELIVHNNTHRMSVIIEDGSMHLFLKLHTKDTENRILNVWYKKQMHALLPKLIEKWESSIGVCVNDWGVRAMKTRWGSCNTMTKRISLNLNLIKKPLLCLEYVLVHEMIHLLEASHNKRFYALMSQFMPEWRDHQKQLEEWSRIVIN